MTRLNILIPSVTSRAPKLNALLDHLAGQMVAGVGVVVYQDNLEAMVGEKCQRLLESSDADYVCHVGDDDWVADDYLPSIMQALQTDPSYVGFRTRLYHAGVEQPTSWINSILPSTLNPMRRSIAVLARFDGGAGEDRRWARQILATGQLRSETFIDRDLYHYRWNPGDSVQTGTISRTSELPARPDHAFVRWI